MKIRHILSRVYPQRFESESIKHLKSLGVNFHENNKDNFIPVVKIKNFDESFNFGEKVKKTSTF
ncbi:hypothetical protein [Cytobacillus praedii]|uniref:hypothetical protein n=1 Tax=Cytobacillus praedii TaxID=1742358 RepID=UPI002E1F40DA|nr:hypothetical protein [Cytobacillus praedii]